MNIEQNRLDTFSEWPTDAVVSPQRVAKAGFYSTKQALIVECFSCHIKISEWNYGDQIMARHRQINPSCPFVLNQATSGNVPIIINTNAQPTTIHSNVPSSSSSLSLLSSVDLLKNESNRLKTFDNWPATHIVTPQQLAKAGFYYINSGDKTKCAYCKGVVTSWEVGDDPDIEHKRLFQDCSFVLSNIVPRLLLIGGGGAANNNNPAATTTTPDTNTSPSSSSSFINLNLVTNEPTNQQLHQLGVQTHKGPKRPNYGTFESRLRSFILWPPDLIQTPDILSHAGFYYEGVGDQVRCFHCDGGLRHWDPQDDPWTEHARWFPKCSFVKLVKGQDFVTACMVDVNGTGGSSLKEVVDQKKLLSNTTTTNSIHKEAVTERLLQTYMTSEAALSALSIGLNVERVKQAIREKLEQTGCGYVQPDALVEAALNLQRDEEDDISSHHHHHEPDNDNDDHVLLTDNNDSSLGNFDEKAQSSISSENDNNRLTSGITGTVIAGGGDTKTFSLEEENRILREARLCKICMDIEVGIVFLPCGHLATCVNCAPNLEHCPVCRSTIKATVRTFLS